MRNLFTEPPSRLVSAIEKAKRRVHWTTKSTVWFDGGLGCQLMGMCTFLALQSSGRHPDVDVSYFDDAFRADAMARGDTRTFRPWELDRYGIDRHSLPQRKDRSRVRPTVAEEFAQQKSALFGLGSSTFSSHFPIVQEAKDLLKRYSLQDRPYIAIHLRRGDYLLVAARLVALSDILAMYQRIYAHDEMPILILSDTELAPHDQQLLHENLPGRNISVEIVGDPHVAHGAMRMSSLLITSNSTFSITAGLLREDPDSLVLSPTHFAGPDWPAVNATSQALSDWMMLR